MTSRPRHENHLTPEEAQAQMEADDKDPNGPKKVEACKALRDAYFAWMETEEGIAAGKTWVAFLKSREPKTLGEVVRDLKGEVEGDGGFWEDK